MEKTSDTIINELLNSFDHKVPESDNVSTHLMAESVKKHKRHDKSKKHKKHKKKSKKYKRTKHHSRSSSPDDYVELKLKKNKLEEAKSGMPVTLDVVMETIVTTANEKSEKIDDSKYDKNKKSRKNETSTDKSPVLTPEKGTDIKYVFNTVLQNPSTILNNWLIVSFSSNHLESCITGLNNGKIVIKDLKDSRLYHELINEIEEKERLKADKYEDAELSCSSVDLDKKKKKGLYIRNLSTLV